ncbi:tyrosyl-tRNA synthetase [Borealophlyctis nickersoniae]|nr:tyrosyl-tRNA synthetase [Borealophlyctis nickersoniae]
MSSLRRVFRARTHLPRCSYCPQQRHLHASSDPIARLEERGLVHTISSDKLSSFLSTTRTAVYAGFDPTAVSLHVGNLLTIIGLLHFKASGHQVIALIGGATGSIGDPSGRSTERVALDPDVLSRNVAGIDAQIRAVFRNADKYLEKRKVTEEGRGGEVKVLNNLDWFQRMSMLDFIGDVGRLARVSIMLARESVRTRMDSAEGISFTEFSYQLLQGYDFYHLNTHHNCTVQLGGSDQWGNIVSGMDIIRKKRLGVAEEATSEHEPAFGLTLPLVTTATGEKFGKSAGNAVWLDERMVSHFDFYQFWRRTPDSEVERYLRYFTLLPLTEIEQIMSHHKEKPEDHLPQRTLAREVTELVHGEEAAKRAQIRTHVLFDGDLTDLSSTDIIHAFEGDNRLVTLPRDKVIGQDVTAVAAASGASKSFSQAKKLVLSGGLYLNKSKIPVGGHVVSETDLIGGSVCLIRTGKSNYKVVEAR